MLNLYTLRDANRGKELDSPVYRSHLPLKQIFLEVLIK